MAEEVVFVWKLMIAVGDLVTLLVFAMAACIYIYTQVVNHCKPFNGLSDKLDVGLGYLINNNLKPCWVTKNLASATANLFIGLIFVYLLSAMAIWKKGTGYWRYLQGFNLIILLPLELAFACFCFYIADLSMDKKFVYKGSYAVLMCSIVIGLMNLFPPIAVYWELFSNRKQVVRTEQDEEEERLVSQRRFELRVQKHSEIIDQMKQGRGGGGRGGGNAGGRGAGRGRGRGFVRGGGHIPGIRTAGGGRGSQHHHQQSKQQSEHQESLINQEEREQEEQNRGDSELSSLPSAAAASVTAAAGGSGSAEQRKNESSSNETNNSPMSASSFPQPPEIPSFSANNDASQAASEGGGGGASEGASYQPPTSQEDLYAS